MMDVMCSKNQFKNKHGSRKDSASSSSNSSSSRRCTNGSNIKYIGRRYNHSYSFQNIINHLLVALFTLSVASSIPQVDAQGVQVCSCAPPVYTWRIDLTRFPNPGRSPSGECPLDITGYSNGGAKGIPLCEFEYGAGFNDDFVPVKLTEFSIIEVNERLEGRKRLGVVNDSFQGQEVQFSSIINLDPPEVPGGFQAEFKAENTAGQEFKLNISIRFSNTCEVLPFSVNDVLGYLVFTEIEQPPAEFCNFASSPPTTMFSSAPSIHPSDSPSDAPTFVPSLSPTKTMEPSVSPVPSVSPSLQPPTRSSPPEGCVGKGKGKKKKRMRGKGKGKEKSWKSSKTPGKGKGKGKGKDLKSSKKPGKGKGKDFKSSKKPGKGKGGKGGKGKKKSKKCNTYKYSIIEPIEELGVPLKEVIFQDTVSNNHGNLRGLR